MKSKLIILAMLLQVLSSVAQKKDISELQISLKGKGKPTVGSVISQLQDKHNIEWAYDESSLDLLLATNLPTGKSMKVKSVLNDLTNVTGTSYQIMSNQVILKKDQTVAGKKFTISGQVVDTKTGEDLIGATVRVEGKTLGVVTNLYGFYSLTLPSGSYNISCSYVGYQKKVQTVQLTKDVVVKFDLSNDEEVLDEVVVVATREEDENITSVEASVEQVNIETVKKMPALFGEIDIIKTVQLLPGVKTFGEGSSGFFVRGGNVDQNLVLLDEAPIYNASHLFGFFSAFNPEAIKDMKLYKGGIPSMYGGRLSSVLDIRMKEGNSKSWGMAGGIGTMMTRLGVEAPVTKKGSIMIGARRSYLDTFGKVSNWVRGRKNNPGEQFFFYDLNAKANYRFSDKDRLFISGYFGRDVIATEIDQNSKVRLEWGNTTGTVRWNHIFTPKLFSNVTYYYSNYDYFLDFSDDVLAVIWESNLSEHSVKLDFGAYLNPNNTLKFGAQTIQHAIRPGSISIDTEENGLDKYIIEKNLSYESAAYVSNDQTLGKLRLDYGLRFSTLQNVGPQEEYKLNSEYVVTDTVKHRKGVYNSYYNFEPRLSARYQLNKTTSIKSSYNRTAQYIQLASNGNFASPFDIWFSSSPQVSPQLADQVVLGWFKNFSNNSIEFSAELYYKYFHNAIDFKDQAELLFNENLEGELRKGVGRAYGLELMLRKNKGKLTGWVSYTLSKAERKTATINNDNWYNAKHDKPHDLSIVATYEITPRISLGTNFIYSSGGAVTFPTGRYYYRGAAVPIYSERNGERLPAYHRLDASLILKNKKNANRRFQGEWVFSVYNAYARKNAFTIQFRQDEIDPNVTYAQKLAIFSIVPSVTYNFRF
ncbi:TonB-dependent receptor [Reichenbachiella versicolor]|uniref:TonB-dependent receptor n=1 Tax=Reichenbachiella versicolor TaxID=1821036 RepID=UPI001C87B28C|nr:TonB-dependent receptor [Reichenbachiella versicolor]